MPSHRALSEWAWMLLVGICSAMLQLRITVNVLGDQFAWSVKAARGVLDGLPHWRVYQGRLFGPGLMGGVAEWTGSDLTAAVWLAVLCSTGTGIWLLWLGRRLLPGGARLVPFATYHALFLLFLNRAWLYPWDYWGILLHSLFIGMVLLKVRRVWLYAVFCVAIWNHENALFLALWLVVDPILALRGASVDAETRRRRMGELALGLACLLGGVLLVEGLREALMVREIGPELFSDGPGGASERAHLRLMDNLRQAGTLLRSPGATGDFWFALLPVAVVGTAGWLVRLDVRRYGALAISYGAMALALLGFGVLLETRIYLALVPLFALVVPHALDRHRVMGTAGGAFDGPT